jgi:hypothetical protein
LQISASPAITKPLTRYLQIARSLQHATNAVHPAASLHAVLLITARGIDFSATEGFDTRDEDAQNEGRLGET